MCGISGIALYGQQETKLAPVVHDFCNRLKHRGPDDEGYYLESIDTKLHSKGKDSHKELKGYNAMPDITELYDHGFHLALGFRRLSIVEKGPAGHQPMQYAKGRYTLVFNGEIYNYKDIKRQLSNDGYAFKTDTDTEVILAAWQKYGPQMLNYFDGMWALALYDSETKVLFLSRDRLGVKPLYYYEGSNFIAFASEIKALAEASFYTKIKFVIKSLREYY
jgi:asparagine synthase (glutamine-hydrolysing)